MRRLVVYLWLLAMLLGALVPPAQAEFINGDLTVAGYINYCLATGATNTYACSLPSAITQYRTGGCYAFMANGANTGSATLNLNGLGAKTIRKFVSGTLTNLVANDIGAGQVVSVCYDGTVMQVQSGSGGGAGGGTVTSIDGSGPLTGGPIVTSGTFGFDSSLPLFLKDGGTTDLVCGGATGKAQVMDNGEFQYCDGAGVPLLHKGVPTQAGLTWNVTPAICTSDGSSGKLTVNGSNQIICAPDAGGAGGSGDITAVGTATTGDAFTDAVPGQRLTYAPMAAPSTPASGKATTYVDSTSKNFAVKTDDGVVKHGVKTLAPTPGLFVTSVEDDGDVIVGAPNKSDVGLDQVDNTSDTTKNASTVTLTNHEVAARSLTCTPVATHIQPNGNTTDYCESYALTAATTIDDPTLTAPHPYPHQRLVFVLRSATPQALTWSAAYSAECRLPLPRATTGDGVTYDRFAFEYNPTSTKWCPVQSTAHPVPPRPIACIPSANHIQPNADTTDYCESYTLAAGTTIDNPIATAPRNHQTLTFVFKSAAPQSLAWDTAYSAECNLALPTVTMGDGVTYEHFLFEYNSVSTKWCPLASTGTPSERVTTLTTSTSTTTSFTCPHATSDVCEMQITGAAGAITVQIPTPAGGGRNGQRLRVAFLCTNAQTLTWDAIFTDTATFTLPATCPAAPTKWLTVDVAYSAVTSKWQLTRGTPAGASVPATVVKTDQANTYTTGSQNMGGATSLILPKAAGAAPTADADARWDTTQHIPVYGENGMLTSSPTRLIYMSDAGNSNNGQTGDFAHTGASITIPANYMVAHRALRLCTFWRFTTTASPGSLTIKVRLVSPATDLATATSGSPAPTVTNNTTSSCYVFGAKDGPSGSASTFIAPLNAPTNAFSTGTSNGIAQSIAIATNAPFTITMMSRWNTPVSGNIVTPDFFTVEALN